MRLSSLLTLSVISAMILVGCGGGGGSAGTDPIISPEAIDINVTITDDYQVESLGTANNINARIFLGNTPKSLYLVLSNNATTSTNSTIKHNAKSVEVAQTKSILTADTTERPIILHHPQYVEDFSSQMSTLFSQLEVNQPQSKSITVPERIEDIEGMSTGTFYRSTDSSNPTAATARKVVSDGVKTLNIWVSDDSFDGNCTKSKCITQSMVDELANTFLKSSSNNDIYDWVTNIYGEEWSSTAEAKYSYLIPANDEITILLTDIDDDGLPAPGQGRVVGFFWPKDNYDRTEFSGSNERVMFYIDSVMFANEDGESWDINDSWPKEMVSTLAHEFQHMIHFYQKNVLRYSNISDNTDTWISEMLSESTEDLIATKIQHIGPRGVDYTDGSAGLPNNTYGRYPLFNQNNTLSLTLWNDLLTDYSKVSAFGAYLIRNYGGAELLHNIMHNNYMDEEAIVSAVGSGKTFANLLTEWGIAIMLSDYDNLLNTPEYNTGWFTDSVYGSTMYEMGSINFFNYDPLPNIYTTEGSIPPQGNYYYKIGDDLTGDIDISLELNGQTEATLIAK